MSKQLEQNLVEQMDIKFGNKGADIERVEEKLEQVPIKSPDEKGMSRSNRKRV